MAVPQQIPVFISYSHKDKNWRDQIASSLAKANLEVLDDTRLLPGQKWLVELRKMLERARAVVLIVTPNSLASYTIQSSEFLEIVNLEKSHEMRLIPVIAEPCDWQESKLIRNIQVFPQSGKALASDPGRIETELQKLAELVIDLLKADSVSSRTQQQPTSSSPSSPRSESSPPLSKENAMRRPSSSSKSSSSARARFPTEPSSQPEPSLAQQVALRLVVSPQYKTYLAMASLVSSGRAVIPFDMLNPSGLETNPGHRMTVLRLAHRNNPEVPARLIAADPIANIAVLELDEPSPSVVSLEIPPEIVVPAGEWESCCISQRGLVSVLGKIGGQGVIVTHEYLTLHLNEPMPDVKDPGGAPVIWNGQLVGIVALANNDGSIWYATPISRRVIEQVAKGPLNTGRPSSGSSTSTGWLTKEDIASFSPAVSEILGRADQIRRNRGLSGITMGVLLTSMAQQEGGQFRALLKDMNLKLDDFAHIDELRNTLSDVIGESGFRPISRSVRRVLISARNKARELGSTTIDESHILFAALELPDHPIIESLKKQGITSDKIKFDAPERTGKSDFLAGVQSDTPSGEDLLDITPEVNALASVLAAKDADPPLALGLFGEWGSGKSFFMGRLESRIRALQDDAQKARKEEAQSSYCEQIVQITFNAWNYIDTNLWASLATEIFEGLASAVAKRRGTDSQAERALVLAAASSSQEVLAETERKKSAAEEELKQTQQQLTVLQNSQGNIETRLSPAELFKQAYRFAIAQNTVKQPLEDAAKQLKIREGTAAAGEIRDQILELRGTWTTLAFILRHGRSLWIWLLVFAGMAGLGWGVNAWLKSSNLPAAANHALAILTAASGFLATFRVWANKALAFVQAAQKSKQELIAKKRQEESAALQKQYEEVQERVKQAATAVASAKQTVDKINKQLENMRADRQMADYIRQRNESTDYTQHLGIIARVRTDFRHLSMLLRDVKLESAKDFAELKERKEQKEVERQVAKEAERQKEVEQLKAEKAGRIQEEEQLRTREIERQKEKERLKKKKFNRKPAEERLREIEAETRQYTERLAAIEAERQQDEERIKAIEAERKQANRAEGTVKEELQSAGKQAPSAENGGTTDTEDKLFPRIDRIILYIDDLDRCPEKNVVEVLQAVHLLLAFPLFIVVVGVDPRWLLRSLETESAVFSTSENNGKAEREEDPLWQSTPMNYLEKIFQIPFTLRPINKDGFSNLVEKFAAAKKQEAGQTKVVDAKAAPPAALAAAASAAGPVGTAATPPAVAPQAAPTQPASQQTGAALPVNPAQAQTPSAAMPANQSPAVTIDRNPAHLQIEDWERAFMKTLHELIPSPRAGKRFINIYRLLRASVPDSERKAFIGNTNSGDYRAVQMLLAILTGYPAEATKILGKLIEEPHKENWGEFRRTLEEEIQAESMGLAQVNAAKSGRATRQRTPSKEAAIGKVGTDAEGRDQRWTELFDKLNRLESMLDDISCQPFCDWAVQIARYSFQSGRVMLYQRD